MQFTAAYMGLFDNKSKVLIKYLDQKVTLGGSGQKSTGRETNGLAYELLRFQELQGKHLEQGSELSSRF